MRRIIMTDVTSPQMWLYLNMRWLVDMELSQTLFLTLQREGFNFEKWFTKSPGCRVIVRCKDLFVYIKPKCTH